MRKLLLLISILAFSTAPPAPSPIETTISLPYYFNGGTVHALLYNVGTTPGKKYPLIIFLHGSGESGTDLSKIYNSTTAGGIPYLIEHGLWTPGIQNFATGLLDSAVVVSPQTNNGWSSSGADVNGYINYMVANYPIDITRIYVTGLSSGGGGATEAAARMDGNENSQTFPLTHKLAAIVPMSLATLTPIQAWANVMVADSVRAWGFGDPNNDTYGANTMFLMQYMNNAKAGFARFTQFNTGHGPWAAYYNPSYRETIAVGGVTASMNIYEWMVLQHRLTNTPTASAGSNQTVNQPATTCTLTGSASVAGTGHSLTGYSWVKTSGPTCTITSASSPNTGITGMTTAGAYVFTLTVTDDASQTSSASVTVTVLSTMPTADAGTSHTVTLPTSSVSLTGTETPGAGHTISSRGWTLKSGPNSPTFSSHTNNSPTVSGLILGTYIFTFTVTDDASQTATADNTTAVISASYASPTVAVSGNQTITLPTSSVSVTSTATGNGSAITSTTWTKLSSPGQRKFRIGAIGSSYLQGVASIEDSTAIGGWNGGATNHGRLWDYLNGLGLIDSLINFGVSGSNVYQGMPTGYTPTTSVHNKLTPADTPLTATNITALLRHNPDVVLIMYPTNGYDVLSTAEVMAAYQTLYDTCTNRGIPCYITTTAPRTDGSQTTRRNFQVIRDSLLNRFTGRVINIYDALTVPGTFNPMYPSPAGDSIHQNDQGNDVMFRKVLGANMLQTLVSSAASITTPTTDNTTITGLTSGVHRFQVTATDAHAQSAVAITTVTVSGTGSPTANAGSPQSITLPTATANLDATASTGATSYAWSQISGPNTASFSGQTAVVATVSGLIAGVYTFRLSINGGVSTAQVVVTVNIAPPVGPCQGAKYFLTADPGDGSVYQVGGYNPGDTLVLPANATSVDFVDLIGQTGCPIVVIGQSAGISLITLRMTFDGCQYVKVTGSGSNNQYGIMIEQDPQLRQQSYYAVEIKGKSKDVEVERVYMHNVDIGIVCETNEDCDNSLNYPNWTLDSMSFHDNKIVGTWNEGMYIGNTSPDNASYDLRPVTCDGITTYPAPMKNGYTHIYSNIVDSTGRGGIQLSNAATGISEINNNTVSHNGMNGDDAQGSAITLGLYTRAYVHDNTIRNTYTWGIASIGAGATGIPVRVENNSIDSAGYLRAYDLATTERVVYDPRTEPTTAPQLAWPQAIEIDTRPRLYTTDTPNPGTAVHGQDSTTFTVRNNTIGLVKSGIALNVDDDGAGLTASGHIACGNLNANGSPATIVVNPPVSFSTNCAVAPPPCHCILLSKPFKINP